MYRPINNLQNNLRVLWRGDLQIAPRDNSFPAGSEDLRAQDYAHIFLGHNISMSRAG